jgi:Mitochondrial carrier protein
MVGGIVSKSAVYPLDLCKKRLQIQKFHNSRTTYGENFVCKGLMDCLKRTVKREGWAGEFSVNDEIETNPHILIKFKVYTKDSTRQLLSQVLPLAFISSSTKRFSAASTKTPVKSIATNRKVRKTTANCIFWLLNDKISDIKSEKKTGHQHELSNLKSIDHHTQV